MLTREAIFEVERVENRHHEQIRSTFLRRGESVSARAEWKAATAAWHAQRYPTDRLWEKEFHSALRSSQREAIEDAILYLEVDAWYFRSGYLKERLIRALKSALLTEADLRRLRNVVWNVAAGRNRREFRAYCKLAVVIVNADFLQRLEGISSEENSSARWQIRYLRQFLQGRRLH